MPAGPPMKGTDPFQLLGFPPPCFQACVAFFLLSFFSWPILSGVSLTGNWVLPWRFLSGCRIDKTRENSKRLSAGIIMVCCGQSLKKASPRLKEDAFNGLKKQVRQRLHWQRPDLSVLARCYKLKDNSVNKRIIPTERNSPANLRRYLIDAIP